MKTSDIGIKLITHFEGLNDGDLTEIGLQPKMDCSSIWTIGWGRALKDTNGSWLKGVSGYKRLLEIYPDFETLTIEEANSMLEEDLNSTEIQLNSLKLNLLQNQFDAVISFIYNCGFGNFKSSTLLRRIKGESGSIQEAFSMFNKSNGKILPGLIARRKTEGILYMTGQLKF